MLLSTGSRDGDSRDATGDDAGVDDGVDGAGVGSLSVIGDVAEMLAVDLGDDDAVVLECGGDAGASAGGKRSDGWRCAVPSFLEIETSHPQDRCIFINV